MVKAVASFAPSSMNANKDVVVCLLPWIDCGNGAVVETRTVRDAVALALDLKRCAVLQEYVKVVLVFHFPFVVVAGPYMLEVVFYDNLTKAASDETPAPSDALWVS